MDAPVRIGIIGDFNPEFASHRATPAALEHAAAKLGYEVESAWMPTPKILEIGAEKALSEFDGLWASAGSPYKSMDGMLGAIQFARKEDWPFLATCGGFQYTLIESARNVLGIADADTAENDPNCKSPIIFPVACAIPHRAKGAPKLSGKITEIRLRPGSFLQSFYEKDVVEEEFYCNYELNPEFDWCPIEAGLPVVARGSQGEVRAIESPVHQFFVATLFQPQLSSTAKKPHPVVTGFVKAAFAFAEARNVLE